MVVLSGQRIHLSEINTTLPIIQLLTNSNQSLLLLFSALRPGNLSHYKHSLGLIEDNIYLICIQNIFKQRLSLNYFSKF